MVNLIYNQASFSSSNVERHLRFSLSVLLTHTGTPLWIALTIPFREVPTPLPLDLTYMYTILLSANAPQLMFNLKKAYFSGRLSVGSCKTLCIVTFSKIYLDQSHEFYRNPEVSYF